MAVPDMGVPLLMTGYNPRSAPGFQGPIHTLLHGDHLTLQEFLLVQAYFCPCPSLMEHRSHPLLPHLATLLSLCEPPQAWAPGYCARPCPLWVLPISLGTLEEKKRGFPLGSDSSRPWGISVTLLSPVLSLRKGPGERTRQRASLLCRRPQRLLTPGTLLSRVLSPFWRIRALVAQHVFSW